MNLRKHVAGFALFSVVVGCAVFVSALNKYLSAPTASIPPVIRDEPISETPLVSLNAINSNAVRLVSLDFINKKSYVTLEIKRGTDQPAAGNLRVTTYFFSPDRPGRVWTSRARISISYAYADHFEYLATGACEWCGDVDAPKAGYFARVHISTFDTADIEMPFAELNRDVTTATPVVVQVAQSPLIQTERKVIR